MCLSRFVELIKIVLSFSMQNGNTPLHIAARSGNLELSRPMLKRAPELINVQNNV